MLSHRQGDRAEWFTAGKDITIGLNATMRMGEASGLPPPAPFLTFCHTLGDISHPVRNPITPQHV